MAFGEYLRRKRKEHGMSQRVLAELIDVSNTEISRIESGERQKPSPVLLRKISEVMHISLEELMHEAGYTPQTDPHEAVILSERKFENIIRIYLEKNDWNIVPEGSTFIENSPYKFRWDCTAKNLSGKKWALEFIPLLDEQKMNSLLFNKVLGRIGMAAFDSTINKLSIVVNNKDLFDALAGLRPAKISLDISIILVDFENERFVQENYIMEV